MMLMLREPTKRERNKPQEKSMMHRRVAHYLLTSTHPQAVISYSQPTPPPPLPVSMLAMTFFVMEYTFGQFRSVSWLCSLSASWVLLAGRAWDTEKSLIAVSTAQHQLKRPCVTNILLTLNPNHTTVPATRGKINPIPAKTRTTGWTKSKMQKRWQDIWGRVRNLWNIYEKVNFRLTDVPTWSKQNAAVKKTAV